MLEYLSQELVAFIITAAFFAPLVALGVWAVIAISRASGSQKDENPLLGESLSNSSDYMSSSDRAAGYLNASDARSDPNRGFVSEGEWD